MNKKLFFTLSFILLLPVLVSAQNWNKLLHIPSDYSTMPNLLYFVILPFLGTFAIIWGILTNLNIFKNYRVNVLLSLIFAFSLMYYGVLLAITHYLFTIGGIVGVASFFILFVILTGGYTFRRTREEWGESKKINEKYKHINKRKKEIYQDLQKLGAELAKKYKDLADIQKRKENAERLFSKLKETDPDYKKNYHLWEMAIKDEEKKQEEIERLEKKINSLREEERKLWGIK
ncbi:MAG: hypothetical protein J7J93_00975 [Candidatus Aenigmarchaeota archaeon]|nr:hypothetical protein [Candidatus Aenigmarchaeota archaeon]